MADGTWRGPPASALQGNVNSQRPRSEIQANPVPPACVQNAMMTKDKKPFTYTPGGIDLSEIRSPRMAKRIERNAQAPGVGEVPKSPNTYYPSGPLPPSVMAAMQPNMPVQVFPSGAAAPPPPPPPTQAQAPGRSIPPPPPPPPPQGPLPTKPVSTNDGVFDRPDMTRIIPENPMSMLRKTPKVGQKTFLDELSDMERQSNRPVQQQYQQSPPVRQNNVQTQQYQQVGTPQNNSVPTTSNQQRSQVGTLYIPPVTTSNGNNNSYDVTSPPTPPIRSPQSPQSPQVQLNKAPRPWQNQKREDEKPAWAHRMEETVSPPQDEFIAPPYKPPQQVQQQPEPPKRQQSYQQPEYCPQQYQNQPQMVVYPNNQNAVLNDPPAARSGVEVVWVTQPQVIVHPGVNQQQQRSPQAQQQPQQSWNPPKPQQIDNHSGRVIPIQVEREQPPNFNRQQSWGAPTQSNSFKKMTSTDEDEGPTTEHGPMTSQQFNQTPADQIRKMKLSQDDRELVHKLRQDEDAYRHQEVDPRYRGPAIPSKAFRLLQSMTDRFSDVYPASSSSPNVPKGPPQTTPHVRNIPIQIEGDESAGQYVHPSQQTVQEPKKYTGGNLPGRSFKMLQSMTGQTSPLGPDQSDL